MLAGEPLFSFSQLVGLGCLQGIIIAGYLFVKPGVSRILAIYLTLLTINMGVSFYIDSGLFDSSMHFISIWRSVNSYLLLGPLLIIFVLQMIEPKRKWRLTDTLHLLPFLITALWSLIDVLNNGLPFFQLSGEQLQQVTKQPLTERFSLFYLLPAAHFIGYLLVASGFALRFFFHHKRRSVLPQLSWIISVLTLSHLMMLSTFAALIFSIINDLAPSANSFAIANFSTVLAFFGLTYLLLRFDRPTNLNLTAQQKRMNEASQLVNEKLVTELIKSTEHKENTASAQSVVLSDAQKQQLTALDALMVKDKCYLNPQLTQLQLAQALALTRHQLSELLSLHKTGSFYELVNHYRIAAVVEAIKTRPATDNIINIAYDCGFSSKSSFNQVFKKYKQQTPSQYRKAILLATTSL